MRLKLEQMCASRPNILAANDIDPDSHAQPTIARIFSLCQFLNSCIRHCPLK
uniref:AlNc14C441G11676 protein n=1 Tax=Albugo laibachii Nc14 TaxID=890382 RepID=F0WZT5_9STRA|nr:AlNc14C441G11676 [Albugo laibachii Nc14]CCA27834.1 AlNc14C730G12454 [Albugo laibachii Nc14]|eukprot:CCA27834.1 AlNc14C730G12454 [Albugo laibachii Nc14]